MNRHHCVQVRGRLVARVRAPASPLPHRRFRYGRKVISGCQNGGC